MALELKLTQEELIDIIKTHYGEKYNLGNAQFVVQTSSDQRGEVVTHKVSFVAKVEEKFRTGRRMLESDEKDTDQRGR